MKATTLLLFFFLILLSLECAMSAPSHSHVRSKLDLLGKVLMEPQRLKRRSSYSGSTAAAASPMYTPVYVGPQDGLKDGDKIEALPGQPDWVTLNQYSGYVTVDPTAGRALFYYFVESWSQNSSSSPNKPLVLWLNGGPGCSSLGAGAMMELGPFRVNSDGATLSYNNYTWTKEANILFLESPAGVGFSYSNTTSDYDKSGDKQTAEDNYTFLVNWLERFPEYKSSDFYITGESYGGHYIPQLAHTILLYNNIADQTVINLKGIMIGNAWIDLETGLKGVSDFLWTHSLISDENYEKIYSYCNFSSDHFSLACKFYLSLANYTVRDIYVYDIYAPLCSSSNSTPSPSISSFDPCSEDYIWTYLNTPEVQKAMHANVTSLPGPWDSCNDSIRKNWPWDDSASSVLPVIEQLMSHGIRVWMYSGDTDRAIPTTATRYSINKLNVSVETPWYPWYTQGEVGGFAVGYKNLGFVTVRGAGHFVPSYQPARALAVFSSFLTGQLPPPQSSWSLINEQITPALPTYLSNFDSSYDKD